MSDIEIVNFSKKYRDETAVDRLSLAVESGEIFGLIGPDGAGKTTLMRTVATLLVPTTGAVRVKGYDVTSSILEIRSLLGYMPQRFSLYQDLTVEQNLNFFAELFHVPLEERRERREELFRFSRLEPFKSRKAGALSGGMKQKLALSCALIHTPRVLVLDEPTFGVDPVSRREFWDILHRIRAGGTTILVSTAYMDEANECDRVALLFKGRLKAVDTPQALRRGYAHPLYRLKGADLRRIEKRFKNIPDVLHTQLFGDALHVTFRSEPEHGFWHNIREDTGGDLQSWQSQEPSIEDIFLELMSSDHDE